MNRLAKDLAGRPLPEGGGTWCRTEGMHAYHCDCDDCDDFEAPGFRAQNDSSCGGELITGILTPGARGNFGVRDAALQLQESAFEVGAEPSLNCGFHVHVDRPPTVQLDRTIAAWWGWEPGWNLLAQGAMSKLRGFNRSLSDIIHAEDEIENYRWSRRLQSLLTDERHMPINLPFRTGTVEFRQWTGTRSAWRMEMYVWLSVALTREDFTTELAPDWTHNGRLGGDRVAVGLAAAKEIQDALGCIGFTETADAVERQLKYVTSGRLPSFQTHDRV